MKPFKLVIAISLMVLLTKTSNAQIQLGGLNSPCWISYLNCIQAGTSNAVCSSNYYDCCSTQGFDWVPVALNTGGAITNVVPFTPGQSVDFQVQIRIPCCGTPYPTNGIQPTVVTFYEIARTDLFATPTSIQTASWNPIGQGTFSSANNTWNIQWNTPLNAPPSGYEIAVKMESPNLPNGFVINSFAATNTNSIPTLSEWALIALAGGLISFGVFYIQRKS